MRRKLFGIILIESIAYQVIVYRLYSKNPPLDFDFDHWTGILGMFIPVLLLALCPYLVVVFMQFFFSSGKKWIKAQELSLLLGVFILGLVIFGTF